MRSSSESSEGSSRNGKGECVVVDGLCGVKFGKIGLEGCGDDVGCEEIRGRELVDSIGERGDCV